MPEKESRSSRSSVSSGSGAGAGAQMSRVLHRGWLWKHGGRVRNWKRRYFVLSANGRLTYFSSESDAEKSSGALGIIDVHKALYVTRRVKEVEESNWPEAVAVDVCFTIITNDRNYGVYSEDPRDADAWVRMLHDVRGDSDASKVTVEQNEAQMPRRQSMSSHMTNFCMRYKILDLSPKLQMMWMKWNNVGQRALKAMADHFGIVEEITMHCDAGSMYNRLPTNRRTRIGEYIFADYMDELRYNVCQEFGEEAVAKKAFSKAFSKRKIKVEMTDDEDSLAPSSASLVDGVLLLTLSSSRFGNGIHLAGKGLAASIDIEEEETISGSSVSGMRVDAAVNILRAMPALEKAASDLQAKLPGKPRVSFRCNYKAVQTAIETLDGSMAARLGSKVIRPIVIRFITELTTYVARADAEVADRIAGESGELAIIFDVGSPDEHDPRVDFNSEGNITITSAVKKILEMNMYDRPPVFNLKDVFV